jgi:C_GCAxxG_C_C family probable redox protein
MTDVRQVPEQAYALGFEFEQKYGNCAQCVLAAIQAAMGGIDDEVFKAANTLAGGGALTTRGTCGALSGGMMAISTRYGRDRASFTTSRTRTAAALAKRLFERFVAEYGSPICTDVHIALFGRSFDFWNPDDSRAFELAGGHVDKCTDVVGKAAQWTVEILQDAAQQEHQSS